MTVALQETLADVQDLYGESLAQKQPDEARPDEPRSPGDQCRHRQGSLPADREMDASDRRVEGHGRVCRLPLELRVGAETKAESVLHDAVIQHHRFRGGVQTERKPS